MTSTLVWLASDDPQADPRQIVDALLGAWAQVAPDVAVTVEGALADLEIDRPVSVELDGAVFGVSGRVRLDVLARRAIELSSDPEQPPTVVGTRIDVALHPVPTIGGPDLSKVTVLSTLALAIGAELVEREGWLWA
ncbi:MAG: hypothetical protein NZ518_02340, partial [Dehalococcoidia bacterium]|nr:hypothetical protein [Dehalococcoidia bacterium]